jgi:hypothetical protein
MVSPRNEPLPTKIRIALESKLTGTRTAKGGGIYIKSNNRLCNGFRFGGLLLCICLQSLLFHFLGLSIGLLVIGSEKINVIVLLLVSSLFGARSLGLECGNVVCRGFGVVAWERREYGFVAGDVLVPPCCVGMACCRGGGEGFEDDYVGLSRLVSVIYQQCSWNNNSSSKEEGCMSEVC